MLRRSRRLIGVLGVGLSGSQVGHLIVYQLRYGSRAAQLESSGVHSYLPSLLGVAGALIGAALLGSLLLIAVTRVVAASARGVRTRPRDSFLDLLAALFALQLATFLAQETVESLVASGSASDPVAMVLLGTLGQLPVAAVGALILRWLTVRVEAALRLLADAAARPWSPLGVRPLASMSARPVDLSRLLWRASRAALAKRGPPAPRLILI